jgi:hypothetical protein
MSKIVSTYETSDIDIASFLIAEGHSELVGFKPNGQKQYFILSPKPDPSVISEFVNDRISVKPAGLLDTRRRLVTALQPQRACV